MYGDTGNAMTSYYQGVLFNVIIVIIIAILVYVFVKLYRRKIEG